MSAPRFPILFITASRVGDAVLTSGLIRKLVEEAPHARFTIVGSALTTPLFRDTPGLDKLIALEKQPMAGHWFKLWRHARGRRWGVVVDLRGSALARFLTARRRAVHRPQPSGAEPVHKVVEAARVLRLADDPPTPFLFTSPETEAAADALLAGGSGPILALAPAANWVGKTWPAERFAVVAAQLLAKTGPLHDGRLLLLGGPSDRFAAEAVRRVIPRARLVDTVGRVDLLTAYALLKRARLFIGNDSGLMHLAAAAGAPTLGLFGPSDERLYAPWGPNTRVLRGPRDFAAFKAIDPKLNQVVCHMFDLPTPWVTDAAKRLLEETADAASRAEGAEPDAAEGSMTTAPVDAPEPQAADIPAPSALAESVETTEPEAADTPAPADAPEFADPLALAAGGVGPVASELAEPAPSDASGEPAGPVEPAAVPSVELSAATISDTSPPQAAVRRRRATSRKAVAPKPAVADAPAPAAPVPVDAFEPEVVETSLPPPPVDAAEAADPALAQPAEVRPRKAAIRKPAARGAAPAAPKKTAVKAAPREYDPSAPVPSEPATPEPVASEHAPETVSADG